MYIVRLSEHDQGVAAVAFSDDERLLASAGFAEDKKLIIWDVGTGNIVTSVTLGSVPTTALTWAGFVKDIKVRPPVPVLVLIRLLLGKGTTISIYIGALEYLSMYLSIYRAHDY